MFSKDVQFSYLIFSTFNYLNIFAMKKIYFLATALVFGANINAQNVVDFESVNLAPESFADGSAGNGSFVFNSEISFSNYTDEWGIQRGFTVSNQTDITTAGFMNQYSAFTGAGNNGSANYVVYTPEATILSAENEAIRISSFKITNTTYAGISMRDGDLYAKQFGSATDANGDDDGTNGEDFFKVWVIGENADGSQKDSLEFFLADYRFSDNSQDYILDTWETVDVSSLSIDVDKLTFRLESSDNAPWGMNTPAYFAIDDVSYEITTKVLEQDLISINVYPNPVTDILNIQGENGYLTLTDANGNKVSSKIHNNSSIIDMSNFAQGVYFLKLDTDSGSVIRKIVK